MIRPGRETAASAVTWQPWRGAQWQAVPAALASAAAAGAAVVPPQALPAQGRCGRTQQRAGAGRASAATEVWKTVGGAAGAGGAVRERWRGRGQALWRLRRRQRRRSQQAQALWFLQRPRLPAAAPGLQAATRRVLVQRCQWAGPAVAEACGARALPVAQPPLAVPQLLIPLLAEARGTPAREAGPQAGRLCLPKTTPRLLWPRLLQPLGERAGQWAVGRGLRGAWAARAAAARLRRAVASVGRTTALQVVVQSALHRCRPLPALSRWKPLGPKKKLPSRSCFAQQLCGVPSLSTCEAGQQVVRCRRHVCRDNSLGPRLQGLPTRTALATGLRHHWRQQDHCRLLGRVAPCGPDNDLSA